MGLIEGILLGVALGTALAWLLFHNKLTTSKIKISEALHAVKESEYKAAESQKRYEEKISYLTESQKEMASHFKSISYEALKENTDSFLKVAHESFGRLHESSKGDLEKKRDQIASLLRPVQEALSKMDEKMHHLDKSRKGDQDALIKQLELMNVAEKELRQETATLVKALRSPVIRGRWGELQLKRVVELAGMVNHCDFYEQASTTVEEQRMRPDLVIRLPGNKQVIVDAKTPFEAYLEAVHADEEGKRLEKMRAHAQLLKGHIQQLGKKGYWNHFSPTPEFVVLFVPSEAFFSAALEVDPTLIELGAKHNVILATPTTLIGLLRAIAFGWKQERMSEHAEAISALGKELYKRISDMKHHWDRIGKSLQGAVDAYNKGVGSLESRVLVSARKLSDYGASVDKVEIDPIEFIEKVPKKFQAQEMLLTDETE